MHKPFPYKIYPRLEHKLQLMVQQLKKNDVWILIDGDEGSGKTNMAAYLLYYFHCATGREFTQDRLYFDSDAMFQWVKEHSDGLINWDEAALGGLSTEWWSNAQTNLLKFAMTGRKKHHVFVLCIPKFDKLTEYLRVDRSIALIHMDMGKTKTRHGHAMYLTRRGKAELNRIFKKTKIRAYAKCMRAYGGFAFDVPYVFTELVNEDAYEKKKDEAISNIGKKTNARDNNLAIVLALLIQKMRKEGKTYVEIAKDTGKDERTIRRYAKVLENEGQGGSKAQGEGNIINIGNQGIPDNIKVEAGIPRYTEVEDD